MNPKRFAPPALLGALTALALLAGGPNQAAALTIDFEEFPNGQCAFLGNSIQSMGFNFQADSGNNFWQCDPGTLQNNTTKAIVEANGPSDFVLTQLNANPFSLQAFDGGSRSVDFDPTQRSPSQGSSGVDVIGTKSDNSQVLAQFLWNGTNFDTFLLPQSFNDLVSVRFTAFGFSNSPEWVFDNIVIDERQVPEPASLGLLALGLLGLGLRRRAR